ncbi:MAG: crossover junction endodeoxyribonuclease RuvC [Tepidisphaeraceae bacterium]|jgi:crossover junction endodeoxyribonuclease RuvC
MRILGIDPGLHLTGYGVVDFGRTPKLIDGGVIRLSVKSPLPQRLAELDKELENLMTEYRPQVCAVEQLYAHYKHPRTAILMAHARGVILLAAQRNKIAVEQFSANRIKQSLVGYGHGGKLQMQRAIQRFWHLKSLPQPPDVADALAVALCCGRQLCVKMRWS